MPAGRGSCAGRLEHLLEARLHLVVIATLGLHHAQLEVGRRAPGIGGERLPVQLASPRGARSVILPPILLLVLHACPRGVNVHVGPGPDLRQLPLGGPVAQPPGGRSPPQLPRAELRQRDPGGRVRRPAPQCLEVTSEVDSKVILMGHEIVKLL